MMVKVAVYAIAGFLLGMSISAANAGHYENGITILSVAAFFVLVRAILADSKEV